MQCLCLSHKKSITQKANLRDDVCVLLSLAVAGSRIGDMGMIFLFGPGLPSRNIWENDSLSALLQEVLRTNGTEAVHAKICCMCTSVSYGMQVVVCICSNVL